MAEIFFVNNQWSFASWFSANKSKSASKLLGTLIKRRMNRLFWQAAFVKTTASADQEIAG
jgi:hypothetical protein